MEAFVVSAGSTHNASRTVPCRGSPRKCAQVRNSFLKGRALSRSGASFEARRPCIAFQSYAALESLAEAAERAGLKSDTDEKRHYVGARESAFGSELLTRKAIVVTMDILAQEDKKEAVSDVCRKYEAWAKATLIPTSLLTLTLEQDKDSGSRFFLYERYRNEVTLREHQASSTFQKFLADIKDLIAEPVRLSLFNELQNGEISSALYPFGPLGEGGCDDQPYR